MKMKFGALVVAGSGKIGGHVASRNRGGAYLRTKTTPSNPNTSFQGAARALLASLASQWKELTPAQRQAWNNAVSQFATTDIFGDIKNPSGINLFIKLNANLINSQQEALTSPPEKVEVIFDGNLSIQMQITAGQVIIASDGDLYLPVKCRFQSSGPVSAGVSNVKSKLRTITSIQIADAPEAIYDAYVAKFGVPVLGQKVFMSLMPIMETGQAGVPQIVQVAITA